MEAKSGGKGCIKNTRGPWKVKKMTKDGQVATKLRFPSERERLQSSQRERQRRSIRHKIFAGLRSLGNYELPKHADTNDLLKALCREAGWHVDEDGTISKKGFFSTFYRDEDDQCARSEVISLNSETYEPHDFLKSFSNN